MVRPRIVFVVLSILFAGTAIAQVIPADGSAVVEAAPLTPPPTPADANIKFPQVAAPLPDVPVAAVMVMPSIPAVPDNAVNPVMTGTPAQAPSAMPAGSPLPAGTGAPLMP